MLDNREKDALVSKARHNLKNPVNAILGFSEMLMEDCQDEGYDSFVLDLEKIHSSGKEILTIIEKSLSDSNLEVSGDELNDIASKMELSLRIPINNVIGYSEMLQEDSSDIKISSFYDDLDKIIKSGKVLTKELHQIIEFDPKKSPPKQAVASIDIKSALKSIKPIEENEDTIITNGRILVVDDNKNNTALLKKRLEKIGNRVVIANDGLEAIEKIDNKNLDLILLDIVMPKMNGYDVLEYLKKDESYYEIPVIMLSSMDDLTSI